MRELESKHKTRKIFYSTPMLILILFILVIFARGAWRALEKERESSSMVTELEAKASQLEARKADLEMKITRLNTEEGIDEELKSKYNVSTEGEQFAVLVEPKENQDIDDVSPSVWYEKWWNSLKSLFR